MKINNINIINYLYIKINIITSNLFLFVFVLFWFCLIITKIYKDKG